MWDAIDLKNKQIVVKCTHDRYGLNNKTKSRKVRNVPMNEAVFNLLLDMSSRKKSLKYVFTELNGLPLDYKHLTHRHFTPDITRAGIKKIRFHNLRTSFASNYCMNGGDIFALSKILGHSSVVITQQSYAHLNSTFIHKKIECINFKPCNVPQLVLVESDLNHSSDDLHGYTLE